MEKPGRQKEKQEMATMEGRKHQEEGKITSNSTGRSGLQSICRVTHSGTVGLLLWGDSGQLAESSEGRGSANSFQKPGETWW